MVERGVSIKVKDPGSWFPKRTVIKISSASINMYYTGLIHCDVNSLGSQKNLETSLKCLEYNKTLASLHSEAT